MKMQLGGVRNSAATLALNLGRKKAKRHMRQKNCSQFSDCFSQANAVAKKYQLYCVSGTASVCGAGPQSGQVGTFMAIKRLKKIYSATNT